jgi:hypothetical protein
MPNPRRKKTNTKKTNGNPLPKRTSSSATKAAQTIKKETVTKTNFNENIGRTGGKDYTKEYSKAKTKVNNYANKVKKTLKNELNIDRVNTENSNVNRISSNHHGLTAEAKDIQNRALSGALEADNVFDKVFNPMGKFISNAMDSTIDNSLLGAGYTLATGKRMSDNAYYDNPYEEQRHQGISAGAGRMAGMAINYGLMRSAFNPQLEQATNAIMNGTRLGDAIKGSSVLGKIGQTTGNKVAQDIGRGLVKETISDATLGFGQNALINYGEGLRGEDFWKQQAKDTAFDFLIGGAMEGAGIGRQIRNANRTFKEISAENASDLLKGANTKEEYIDALIERANRQMDVGYEEGIAPNLKKIASDKSNEFLEEAAKVDKMSNKQFNRYKLGRDIDENVKYYDTRRGKTVRNAYEGDLETVKKTPSNEREKFGNRPKNVEETTTAKAETPEPEVKETVDETVTVQEEPVKETKSTKSKPQKGKSLETPEPKPEEPAVKEELKAEKPTKKGKAEPKASTTKEAPQPEPPTENTSKIKIKESVKEADGYKVGDKVVHKNYGKGEVIGFEEFTREKKKHLNAVIRFESGAVEAINHKGATETKYLSHLGEEVTAPTLPKAEEVKNTVTDTRKPNMNMKFKTLLGLQDSDEKFKIIERKINRYNEANPSMPLEQRKLDGFDDAERWYLEQKNARSNVNGQKTVEPSIEGRTAGDSGTESILQGGQGNDGVRRELSTGRNDGEARTGEPKSLLVSEDKQKILDTDKTIKEKTVLDYSDNIEDFNKLLDDNRKSHPYGFCVDKIDADDLPKGSKFITTNDGAVTIGIKPKGTGADVVGLSKSPNASKGTTTHEAFMNAIALGGDRSDQYGQFLTTMYNDRYGFIPVARVKYNEDVIRMLSAPEEVEPKLNMFKAMEEEGNIPDVFISAKFDDLESTIKTRAEGGYKKLTKKDFDKLPLFEGEDAYDKALAYRDELLDDAVKREEFLAGRNKKTKKAKGSLPTQNEVKEATSVEITSREAIDKLTNSQLKSMCDDYKIEVTPTGKRGKPVHQDYVDAVSKHFEKAEGENTLEAALSKAKEKVAPNKTASAKGTPVKDIETPDELEIGKYVVHEEHGVGKITGFKKDKYLGKTMIVEFADDSMEQAVDKANIRWKMYAGDDTPELGIMHKPKAGETVSVDTATTINTNGENASTTMSGNGTETFTSTVEASDVKPKKPLKQLRKNTELPKGEKAKTEVPKKQKPITSGSSYQEVEARFGGSEKNKHFTEIEDFISQYKGKDTAKAIETYLRSDKISHEAKKFIMEMRENGEAFTKEVVTNKSVLEEAERRVKDNFDGMVAAFFNKAKSGEQFTSQDMADGFHIAKKYMEDGEFRKAAEINGELSAVLSEHGRFLQSQRMWRSLTPEGRISSTLASIRKLEKSRGMKRGTIQIGEEGEKLLKAIYEAKTNKEIAEANNAFATYVWNQVPRTFAEKANAWRYLAMLGNPKTHIRNILGNALFIPSRAVSDGFAAGLEKVLSKRIKSLGGEVKGHHAVINRFSAEDRELLKKAGESFKDDRDLLESITSKMFERQRAAGSPIYNTKLLDFLEKFNTKALDKEDVAFMGFNYRSAYAQYLKANGIKASDVTEEIAKKASEYAQDQALKATYRDANKLAEAFNKMRKNLNVKKSDDAMMKIGKSAGGFLMDSTIPFVKTPLNILKRGTLEYSPIGVARGLGRICAPKNADDLLKGIEYFSNGLTGTGVLALGVLLANRGIINGSLGDWGKEKSYEQMLGKQDYAVTVGDTSITLDWMAPMSMPFFVGVEAASGLKDGVDGAQLVDALSNIADPIFEMSMLQGIENNFNMAFSDQRGLSTIAKNAGFNYLSQFVPTFAGQVARTRVKDRKTVVSTATNPLTKSIEKNLGKILNKVPIAGDVINQDYVDLWGRTDSKESASDYGVSLLENLFSPAYIAKKNETEVDKEIQDLYSKLGEEDKEKILPTFASNAFKQSFDDKEYNMTPAEFTQYKKTVGAARYSGLKKLFKTSDYKNASVDEKRKMIENVYDEANAEGKKEYLSKVDKTFASAPDFYMLDSEKREKYDEGLNIKKNTWAKAYTEVLSTNRAVNEKTGENLSYTERAVVLAENGVTTLEQAQSLYKNMSESAWENGYAAYKNGKTAEQVIEDERRKVERQKNMTESQKKIDNKFYSKYDGKAISEDLYNKGIREFMNVDKGNDDNGSIKQSEAKAAIERLDKIYGLTQAQKAYFWHLAENDSGWKSQPYGKWRG